MLSSLPNPCTLSMFRFGIQGLLGRVRTLANPWTALVLLGVTMVLRSLRQPQVEEFYQCNLSFTCENDEKLLYKIVKADYALEIHSNYHSVGYNEKFLDIWMFTNSTEVTLNYNLYRRGQEKPHSVTDHWTMSPSLSRFSGSTSGGSPGLSSPE